MRILGIDYGDKKIGIAVSDPFGWTAQGIETIKYEDANLVIERIGQLIKEYKIEKIVVGFPKNMNGTLGPRAEYTEKFITILSDIFKIEIIRWDERLSTVAAENILINADISRKKRKGLIDKIAAVYILQGYLDFMNKSNKEDNNKF